jgi:hypothetical protein
MMRIFFAATVGFAIPVDKMLTFKAWWQGMIMGIVACVGTKLCCAFWIGEARWVIGWAMVGRAEFAYLIAEMAKTAMLLDGHMFSVTIWALVVATFTAPTGFMRTLKGHIARLEARRRETIIGEDDPIKSGARPTVISKAKLLSENDADQPTTLAPVPVVELFDKRWGLRKYEDGDCVRVRMVFKRPPAKSLNNLVVTDRWSLSKLSATREGDRIMAVFALKTEMHNKLVYSDLQAVRHEVFTALADGGDHANVKEMQFLPPESSALKSSMCKMSVHCKSETSKSQEGPLAIVSRVLADEGFYPMQVQYNTTLCGDANMNIVCYPMPDVSSIADFGTPAASLASNVDLEAVKDSDSVVGKNKTALKQIAPMDVVMAVEDVSTTLVNALPKLQQSVCRALDRSGFSNSAVSESSAAAEVHLFDTDPLKNWLHPLPLDGPKHTKKADRDLTFLQISYKCPLEALQAIAGVTGGAGGSPAAKLKRSKSWAPEELSSDGQGMVLRDAASWTRALPDMLTDLAKAGFTLVHVQQDHMLLIDRPVFVCVLDSHHREDQPKGVFGIGRSESDAIPESCGVGTDFVHVDVEGEPKKANPQDASSLKASPMFTEIEGIVNGHLESEKFHVYIRPISNPDAGSSITVRHETHGTPQGRLAGDVKQLFRGFWEQ